MGKMLFLLISYLWACVGAQTTATATVDPNTIAQQLQVLLGDPRFQACTNDPSDPLCVDVRNQAEQTIVQEQNLIDTNVLVTQSFLNSLKQELTDKVAELKSMNQTLNGGLFSPGLLEQLQAITDGTTQLGTLLTGADANIQNEITVRGQLYSDQMTAIATQEQESATEAQNAMLNLANSNLLSQTSQMTGISNNFAHSLADVQAQADSMISGNEQQLSDLVSQVNQNSKDVSDQLSVLTQSAQVAMQDARAVAAVGNATFKQAESSMITAASNQLPVYQTYADGLLAQAQSDMNSSLTNSIQTVSNNIVNLNTNLIQQFSDDSQAVYDNITNLKEATANIVPTSIQRASDLVTTENGKIALAQSTAQTNAQSIQKLTTDTSNLLSDLMNQIETLSQSARDGQTAAKAQLDQQISGISSNANTQAGTMTDGVSSEISNLAGQLGQISQSNGDSIQSAQDAYLSQLAGISSDSGSDSLATVGAMNDANSAANNLASLNAAKLQQTTDGNSAKLNTAASTVMGALSDSQDTLNEMDSEFSAQNRALQMNSNQLVTDTNSANSNAVSQLSASVGQNFQDVQSAALSTQKLSQSQILDLKQALSALSDGASASGQQTNQLQSLLQGTTSDQLVQFQTLLGGINTSYSLINSTGAQAQAQLQTAVANTLNSRMAGLQSTLQSSAQGVTSQLSQAAADALSTTNALATSGSVLNGNFQKTNTDMSSLISTLSGATSSVNSNAQSLQNLLGSMTNQEIVNFQLQVANLSKDTSSAQTTLRDYLLAMITNKTDAARTVAQSAFYSNQQALSGALDQTSSELSKTQDLASQAILSNQIISANASKIFNDFLSMENDVNNATATHATILASLTQNITDWKTDIITRIHAIQANVSQGSAALPEQAQQRLDNITALISSSQSDLEGFLKQFEDALAKAKAVQDQFQDNQSARIIAAMTGVSQAIVAASMQMASQVANSDLSANDKAKALTTVLSELCDSINQSNADAASNDAAIAAKVHELSGSVNGSLSNVAGQINSMMTDLATKQLHNDIDISNSMEAAVTNAGVGINASANALDLAQNAIQNAVQKSAAGWANNNKNTYTLGGFLFSLSQQSQQKLLYILQQLQSGQMDMDQAISLARQADISQIKSAQDVVAVLAGAMDGYDETVDSIFGNSFDRMQNATNSLSGQVDLMATDLVTLASMLDYNSSLIAHRVDQFGNVSNDFINQAQTNVTNLQNYIFDQQSQVTKSMSALSNLMDFAEKDVTLRQQQFSNWIDSLIANETQVIANKTSALKQQLLGSANTTASSFADLGDELSKENVKVLQLEMRELERRKNLRKQFNRHQSEINTDYV